MKKIFFSIALLLATATCVSARDNYSRDASVLPVAAQQTIKSGCKGKVSLVKTDKDFGRVNEYEVILNDGTEIKFDRAGNWKEVEVARGRQVPAMFVVKGISTFVNAKHKGSKIVGIEKKRGGYEVELDNGIELKFDLNGKFERYDD